MKYKLNNKVLRFNSFSFDYDGTLDDDYDGTQNLQKHEIQNICKYLVEIGKDVYIITKRHESTIEGECNRVYEMAKKYNFLLNINYTIPSCYV